MKLFRGYIKTDGKKAIEKFKNVPDSRLHTLEEVKEFDSYAGILAPNVIMVDVDDVDDSEILMDIICDNEINCTSYKTTRGRHFYFKNTRVEKCKTNIMLSCGIVADIKIGKTNSYDALKVNGNVRECDYKYGLCELPEWLIPVDKVIDFQHMEKGDGRNSELFSYILELNKQAISKEDSRKCIEIINDYLLPDKLSKSEIDTIARDEAFPKDLFYEGKSFCFDKLAQYLINNCSIITMHGRLFMYNKKTGIYEAGERFIEKEIHRIIPRLRYSDRMETIKCLYLIAPEKKVSSANYIAFKNGIYDLNEDKLLNFSPEYIIPNKINWNYNPNAYDKHLDKMFNKISCNDKSIRMLIEEVAGYIIYRRNELSKFFIFVGEKANGKSTYISVLQQFTGEFNSTALDIGELGDRFKIAMVDGKLANFGDDISDEFQKGNIVALLKKMVSGNTITGEFKGKDAFDFKPYVKLVFSANDIPHIKDRSGAVLRRMVLVPFNATFSKNDKDYDPHIIDKLITESAMEYLAQLALDGLRDVLENKDFSNSKKSEKLIEEYHVDNDPVLSFLDDFDGEIVGNSTRDIFEEYTKYAIDEGVNYPLNKKTLVKNLNRNLGLTIKRKTINGKQMRIFVEG